jgi:hypothetical protein
MSRPAGDRPPRPSPSRRGRRRAKMPMGVAIAMILAALVLGVLIGYVAHGDDQPVGLLTQTRELPLVTVTEPSP